MGDGDKRCWKIGNGGHAGVERGLHEHGIGDMVLVVGWVDHIDHIGVRGRGSREVKVHGLRTIAGENIAG